MAQGVLAVLVSNHYGVLTRVSSLFGRKGFNIRSISAGETENPAFTRITIIATGDPFQFEQMRLQLEKLEDVKQVQIIPSDRLVSREMMLVKIHQPTAGFTELTTRYDAKEMDHRESCSVWTVTGTPEELDRFLQEAAGHGILESCRTGAAAMEMGIHPLI